MVTPMLTVLVAENSLTAIPGLKRCLRLILWNTEYRRYNFVITISLI